MTIQTGLFSSESVAAGHPDKACDQISDAILDAFLQLDPHARVACEAFAAHDRVIVAGEFRTREPAHFQAVREDAEAIVRRTLRQIGYSDATLDLDPDRCPIDIRFNHQSLQIGASVDRADGELGAGDQGLMFGYATDETPWHTPLAWTLATQLVARGSALRGEPGCPLRADGKSQVTVRIEEGVPKGVTAIVLSWQHDPSFSLAQVREYLQRELIDAVIPDALREPGIEILLNPAGAWTIGGPIGDTGLTGRKIIVDTYGASCPHGGGAFSGKDPSKVDRSAAYAARYVARHVVVAGLSRRCTVQLAYAIGRPEPISVAVDLHGTGTVGEHALVQAIREVFDLRPAGIIRELDLLRPIYQPTAAFGHFGPLRDPVVYRWESTPRIEDLQSALRGTRR